MFYEYNELSHYQILQRDSHTDEARVITTDCKILIFKTGGPYTIGDKHDIYVGDIWVMAGQSNMRGHGFLHDSFRPKTTESLQSQVHLFDSTETWRVASDPTHRLALSKRNVHHTLPDPTVRHPELCKYRGASLGPSFGAHYEKNVPVGLIASAHGGVTLNDWKRPTEFTKETFDTTLYGAMIDRTLKTGNYFAGVLWYQGESDTVQEQDADTYGERFEEWIETLRNDTRSNLPVVFVQLGSHRVDVQKTIKNWRIVQDQQRQLMGKYMYTVGVASIDCGLDDRLHLSRDGLEVLGKRLARAASLALKGSGLHVTPLPKSATYQNFIHIPRVAEIHSIKLEFDLPDDFLFQSDSTDIGGFELENHGKVIILRARIENDMKSIRLYLSGSPTKETTICYGMNQNPLNLNVNADCILPAFQGLKIFF
ncbi:SGNH hydrolase-type esterase domain-containing protein [Pilaira anomala]|nr:SGNH hydrolase-type esterase domain-containing protein [Pilaira anomala]